MTRIRQIQSFSTSGTEQEALNELLLGKPYVCFIEDGRYIDWNTRNSGSTPEPIYSATPLTFKAISGGTIIFMENVSNPVLFKPYMYSVNGGDWIVSNTSANTEISLNTGDYVQFKGTNTTYASGSSRYSYFSFKGNAGKYIIYGNIMSLIDQDNYVGLTVLPDEKNTFRSMFGGNGSIIDASNLILPATTLRASCYADMFGGCFNLVTAPELPATTLADACYYRMFLGCTSLTTAPVLPATTLTKQSYNYMFQGCSNLSSITCLATNISASNCTTDWVTNVSETGTFYKNPDMSSWTSGDSGIPTGWTVVDA